VLTLPDHFDLLLSKIEPEEARAKSAASLPWKVREYLQSNDRIETVDPHSRLAGSYARHVAIKGIKDVDIVLFVAPAYKEHGPELVLDDLFSALGGLAEALDDTGEVVKRRRQRLSIQVRLVKHEFDLDIVPAVAPDGMGEPLMIPDREWVKWVETHPLGYADCLSGLNKSHGEKIVPLVKLLKHWRDVQMAWRKPKSYWLECMIYHQFAAENVETADRSYAEIWCDLLDSLQEEYAPYLEKGHAVPEVADPMLGKNVAYNWERAGFETFMRRLDWSCEHSRKALDTVNLTDAVLEWQQVFGTDWFPNGVDVAKEQGKRLLAAAKVGGLSVGTSGNVMPVPPAHGRYVEVPPQRFYGDS
jgi:hypothetical protein